MKPTNRLFLFALISFLLFGTVPVAFAQDQVTQEPVDIVFIDDVANATPVKCGDPTLLAKLDWDVDPVELVDYYQIILDPGQALTVDVDSESIANDYVFDYILQLFDINGTSLTYSDDASAPGESTKLDPYLKFTATEHGTYIVAVSTWDANATSSYEITFECTDVGSVNDLHPGDLLASTGPSDASLIFIDKETGKTDVRGPLGQFGQVVDIEFRDDGVLFGAAVDELGTIITIDPDTGVETKIGTLESGYVTALEFGGDPVTLYGIYQASESADSQLGTINQGTGAFTVVGVSGAIDGYRNVGALAYDSLAGTMYGVGTGFGSDGIDLMTIDLATGVAKGIGPTGITSQILALEFGPDGKLYGVTAPYKPAGQETFVTALVTIDTLKGIATEVLQIGGNAAEAAALAAFSPTSMVNGLTFKPGGEPQPTSAVITSLDDNPFVGRLIDKFKFKGIQGESVTIIVDLLKKETEDQQSPEVIETTSKWNKWSKKNFLVDGEFKGHAFLSLRDAMCDVDWRVREKGPMPLIIEEVLPATGLYYLILMQPVPRALRVDYSLTMTSSADAFKTLEATRLIGPRNWTDCVNKETDDNTEQNGAVSTLQSTSLSSTSESTPMAPATDGGSEDGQTTDNTTNTTDDSDDVDEGDSEAGQTDDGNIAGADAETTTGEDQSVTGAGSGEDEQKADDTTTADDPGDVDGSDSEDTQGDDGNTAGADDDETTDEVVTEVPPATEPDAGSTR